MGPVEVHVITHDGATRHLASELPALLARDDVLVWVDIPDCDADAQRILTEVFGLHATALQTLVNRNRIPRLHVYPDQILVVVHAPERGERGHVHYVELD